jgi:hypothetical protein
LRAEEGSISEDKVLHFISFVLSFDYFLASVFYDIGRGCIVVGACGRLWLWDQVSVKWVGMPSS